MGRPSTETLPKPASHHVVPVLVLFATAFFLGPDAGGAASRVTGGEGTDRLVLLIVDSLRRDTMEAPGVMPSLLAWSRSEGVVDMDVRTCSANFSLPCMQTLIEGRESPFSAGLHNFTGREGGAASLPAAAAAAGVPYAVISDMTLTSLYGRQAVRSINVEDWGGSYVERDLRALDEAMELLRDPSIRMVLVHVPGTDKAAHLHKPGSAEYEAHFRAVDERLGRLLALVDPSRDAVMIAGDHGHDAAGHHTRESVAVLGGAFRSLTGAGVPNDVQQVDLIWALAWPNMLPLPPSWEGAWPAEGDSERLARYEELQRQALAAAGYEAPTLAEAQSQARESRDRAHLDQVLALMPLLACLFVWVSLGGGGWRLTGGMAALAAVLAAVSSPSAGPWLAAPVLGVGLWFAARTSVRQVVWLVVLLAGTALIARHALGWSQFFHSRGGVVWQTPLFYATLAAAGAILALVRDGSARAMGSHTLAFALFCVPSGVYYYQAGQNLLHPIAIGSAVWGCVELVRRRWTRPRGGVALPLALVLVTLPLLFLHEAGGWEYDYYPVKWLEVGGPAVQVALWYALGAALVVRLRGRWERLCAVALVALGHGYGVVLSGLPMSWLVVSQVPAVFAAGWLALPRGAAGASRADETEGGLVLLGAALFAFWLLFRGFFFSHIDFTAGLRWFGDLSRERDVFALAWAVTAIKYAIPVLLVVLAVRAAIGARVGVLLERALWFANLKVLALVVAVQASGFDRTEKLWEVALGDLIFVAHLILMLACAAGMVRLLDRAPAEARVPAAAAA